MKKNNNIQHGDIRICKSTMVCFYTIVAHFKMKKYKYGNDLANMNANTIHIYMMESITLKIDSIKFWCIYIMSICNSYCYHNMCYIYAIL